MMSHLQGLVSWIEEQVKEAVNRVKSRNAAGSSGLVAEMLKASGNVDRKMVTELLNVN